MKKNHILKKLRKLVKVKRKKHHVLIHRIHKDYNISRKTLFYVKEYGTHSNVIRTIIKESIFILIIASLLSSFGGLSLEYIKKIFLSFIPLIILIPVLNDMIGNYGTVISSKFSTMLHEGKIKKNVFLDKKVRLLFTQIFLIAIFTVIIACIASFLISKMLGHPADKITMYKILFICLIDVSLLIVILFLIAIFAGIYLYKKKEDPNNFLIPITTSIADFGNMIILSILVWLMF